MRDLKACLLAATFALAAMPAASALAANGDTLKQVKERGLVLCGVHPARHGFAAPDSKGVWEGFEVDF